MNIRQSDNQVHYENDPLEVGYMTYLNSEVFYRKLPPDSCRLHRMHPRDMALAVEQGDIHAGPLPVAEVMRLNGTVRSLAYLGVACDGAPMSVFVFSHYPIKELSGRRIAVTSHTATSIQLLRVLLVDLWDVTGHEFVTMSDTYDAALVIGDPALELLHKGGFRHHYDLGAAWKNLTGLPFVFADSHRLSKAHRCVPPLPLERLAPELPSNLAAMVMKMLAKEPGRRPHAAEVVSEMIELEVALFGQALQLPAGGLQSPGDTQRVA